MAISRFRELIRAGVPNPFTHPEGGGKGSAPPAPDYTGAANAQSAASKEIATAKTWADRPTLNTPWGQQTWEAKAGTDPSTGQPITNWTSNINLTPEQQSSLDSQQRIQQGKSGAAETLLGQATGAFQSPMDWNALPGRANTPGSERTSATTQTANEPGFVQQRQDIQNALFEQMRPEHQRQEDATRTRLANMGLSAGSEAYNRELERLQGTQAGERFNAMNQAGNEQQRLQGMLMGQQQQAFGQNLQANAQNFGQGMQGANFQNQNRQQAIAEEQLRRGMPLNELNALLTGQQVSMPGMPSFNTATAGQAPQLLQAAQAQGNYNMDAAQQNASSGADIGSLIGTGAKIAGMAGMFSDARLKSRIRRIGTHARGIGIYRYVIGGRDSIGVLAQEVLEVAPHLVTMTPSGYLAVNYGGL